jgi:thiamine transporter 2/3
MQLMQASYLSIIIDFNFIQIAFGIASSSEIAYFSYVYAVVDKRHFQKLTSYVRTATLIGKFFAFSMAQFLITTNVGSYTLLNQVKAKLPA